MPLWRQSGSEPLPSTAPLVLHVFPTFAVGGAQVRFATIANCLGDACRHAVIALDGDTTCRSKLTPALDVTFPPIMVRKRATLANVWRFRRALRTLRPDLLVTSNWGSIEWAMANAWPRVRHIHMEDGFGPEERSAQLPRRAITRRIVLRRSTVVLPSQTLLRIATGVWRLDPAHLRHIPNGIDLARFLGPPSAERAIWRGQGPVIGTVAALRPEKNLARLLRAVRLATENNPARLVIVGDGSERPGLERLVRELGLTDRVQFTGYVAEPQHLYRGFDLFALSSDTEQMPLSVLEAMAAGLPVAATDVGDVRTMLALENAPFVAPLDEAALAACLAALLSDAVLRRIVGAANRAKAERDYDEQTMVRAYAALFAGAQASSETTPRIM